jgi:hypothetical protein
MVKWSKKDLKKLMAEKKPTEESWYFKLWIWNDFKIINNKKQLYYKYYNWGIHQIVFEFTHRILELLLILVKYIDFN